MSMRHVLSIGLALKIGAVYAVKSVLFMQLALIVLFVGEFETVIFSGTENGQMILMDSRNLN